MPLLFGHHHRGFESWGSRIEMCDGMPWWPAPTHLEAEQKPVLNTAHLV